MKTSRIKSFLVLFFFFFFFSTVSAQDVGSIVLGTAIEDLRKNVNSSIAEGHRTGNALVIQVANEVANLLEMMKTNYSNMLDVTIDKLDPKLQDAYKTINNAVYTLEKMPNDIKCLEDDIVLNIRQLLNDFPLTSTGKKYIQSVSGSSFHKNRINEIVVRGTELKIPNERERIAVDVTYDNWIINDIDCKIIEDGKLQIIFPDSLTSKSFSDSTIRDISTSIRIRYFQRKKIIWLIPYTKKTSQLLNLKVLLIPEIIGRIKLEGFVPLYSWGNERVETVSWLGPDAHCEHDCRNWFGIWTERYSRIHNGGNKVNPNPGDERITSVTPLTFIGGPAGYDVDHMTEIVENGTRAHGKYRARTKPTSYQFSYRYESYGLLRNDKIVKNYDLRKGSMISVELPVDTKAISITGFDLYNIPIAIDVSGSSINKNPIVSVTSKSIVGDKLILKLHVDDMQLGKCK